MRFRQVRCAKAIGSPVIVTEQYPKALGHTVPELQKLWAPVEGAGAADLASARVFEKTLFSMLTPEVSAHVDTLGLTAAVIFGLEVRQPSVCW